MRFEDPERLGLLVLVAILGLVVFSRRRRVRDAVHFGDAGLLEELRAVAPRPWRRRAVAGGLVVSMVLLVLAAADPVRRSPVETTTQTVVLAVDVSKSMEAPDVEPTRLDAAKRAARAFLDEAPASVSIGLVSFSSTVRVVAAPTRDRAVIATALDALRTDAGTAVGEAVFTSIGLLETRGWEEDTDTSEPVQLRSGAVVVLSDGASTVGRPDADAAAAAAQAGVQIYTIAFGTPAGVIQLPEGSIAVPANPGVMALYADETGAATYQAFTEAELASVFTRLASSIATEEAWASIADLVALIGLVFLAATAVVWARTTSRL